MSLICDDITDSATQGYTCPPLFQRVQLLVSTSCTVHAIKSNSPFHTMVLRGWIFYITESFKSYVHESENTIERMTAWV